MQTPPADPVATFLNNLGETKDIIFFVGAGISVSSGYPLWKSASEKATKLALEKGLPAGASAYAAEKLNNVAYYELFQILKNELTGTAYRDITTLVFGGENKASNLHRRLAKIQSRGIITTNFDECVLSACVLERGGPPLTDIPYALASEHCFVIKAHGSIQNPETMVLATEDWKRVEADGSFKDLLT
jgi:NAD-dependent SIR2 family protein deacetylase